MRIALVGQPNSGKSTLFNALAGYRSLTSNFAGTTVEYTRGRARVAGEEIELIDLPGLYSLSPANTAEICSREFLLAGDWDVLVNVLDASQLARSLELTLELKELEVPLVVCLNMMDEAARKGMSINVKALAKALGVPVREAIAARGQGIVETFVAALELCRRGETSVPPVFPYTADVEAVMDSLARALDDAAGPDAPAEPSRGGKLEAEAGDVLAAQPPAAGLVVAAPAALAEPGVRFPNNRFRALQLLQSDPHRVALLPSETAVTVERARDEMWRARGQPADLVISSARHASCLNLFERVVRVSRPRGDWREQVDRWLMHPFWGYVFLALIFLGFFRLVFSLGKLGEARILTVFADLIAYVGHFLAPHGWPFAMVKGALLGTAGAFAIVLPYLVPFLVGLAILEDAGYLARVGYLMDAAMHRLGLHGTATIPVLLGYGCSVPAVMATRILTSRRDRFIAAFLAVLVPCSARMTVIMALTGFYLGAYWALAIYALNIVVVALAGNVLARIWPEVSPGLLMEVPPYHHPVARVVVLKTWWRLREFVVVALPLLVVGSAVLGLIEFFGWQPAINRALSPLTALLGLPAVVGLTLIFGVLRKELSLLMLMQALGTTNVGSVLTTAQIVVFTLFVTFYLPCLATLASLVRELGRKLTLAASGALLALAIVIGLLARGVFHLIH
ncbi:MAG: ferrous iron transport protein B [Acidobacteriia bacterium]|nr:ferrous iron transport protein B [Terriglobia bacterium]